MPLTIFLLLILEGRTDKPGSIYKMYAPSEVRSLGGKVLAAFILTALYCQAKQKGTGTKCVAMEILQTWSVANLWSLRYEVMLICISQFVGRARSPGSAKVNRFGQSGNCVYHHALCTLPTQRVVMSRDKVRFARRAVMNTRCGFVT